jgi:hypothetical protein
LPTKASTPNREAGTWVDTSLRPSFSAEAALLSATLWPPFTAKATAYASHFILVYKTVFIFIESIKKPGHLFGNLRFTDLAVFVFIESHQATPFLWATLSAKTTLRTTLPTKASLWTGSRKSGIRVYAALRATLSAKTSLRSASLPPSKFSTRGLAHTGTKAWTTGNWNHWLALNNIGWLLVTPIVRQLRINHKITHPSEGQYPHARANADQEFLVSSRLGSRLKGGSFPALQVGPTAHANHLISRHFGLTLGAGRARDRWRWRSGCLGSGYAGNLSDRHPISHAISPAKI